MSCQYDVTNSHTYHNRYGKPKWDIFSLFHYYSKMIVIWWLYCEVTVTVGLSWVTNWCYNEVIRWLCHVTIMQRLYCEVTMIVAVGWIPISRHIEVTVIIAFYKEMGAVKNLFFFHVFIIIGYFSSFARIYTIYAYQQILDINPNWLVLKFLYTITYSWISGGWSLFFSFLFFSKKYKKLPLPQKVIFVFPPWLQLELELYLKIRSILVVNLVILHNSLFFKCILT